MLKLRAPFPWFGGKSRVAHVVWDYFGDVSNFVEPFFGSGAVLLGRPFAPRTETVNDKDCYLANFWRAVQHDPETVAHYCDGPVNEADLHARHRWLVNQAAFRERMMSDPDYYDPKIAGWWCWGISQWIGSGWCSRPEWVGRGNASAAARGIHTSEYRQRPSLTRVRDIAASAGWRKRPNLGRGGGKGVLGSRFRGNEVPQKMPTAKRALGSGVLRSEFQLSRQLPQLHGDSGAVGRGVVAKKFQLPQLRSGGTDRNGYGRGVLAGKFRKSTSRMGQWTSRLFLSNAKNQGVLSQTIRSNLIDYMLALADRLRAVRVCCGDWKRVLGPSPTTCIGTTAVFLDPPYSEAAGRDGSIYNSESLTVATEVAAWCVANGDNPKLRIALCGYEGEHTMPKSWTCVAWKANGGYGNQGNGAGRSNAGRERIWFSPHCLKPGVLAMKEAVV